MLFQSSYQTILIFSESYWTILQTILYTFPELASKNTDIFRVPFKLNYSTNFLQSSYHTILIFSENNYQTILTYSELISNSIHTFIEFLANNSKHFFESFNEHLDRQKILKQKIPK